MLVSNLLLEGKDNAIKGAVLVNVMELKDLRHLTQLIESERRAGLPICASTSTGSYGYYVASNAEELENYIKSLDRRIHNVSLTRRHLEATLLRMTGQGRMEGF